MITPHICQDYFASLFGHEGVAENAHQFAVMLGGGWSEGETSPFIIFRRPIPKTRIQKKTRQV